MLLSYNLSLIYLNLAIIDLSRQQLMDSHLQYQKQNYLDSIQINDVYFDGAAIISNLLLIQMNNVNNDHMHGKNISDQQIMQPQYLQQNPYNLPDNPNNLHEQNKFHNQLQHNHQDQVHLHDINPQFQGLPNQNPYIQHHQYQQNNINQLDVDVDPHLHAHNNPHNPQPNRVQIINGNQHIEVNNAPQNIIIVNGNAKPIEDPVWKREQRIGCCCFSTHHQSCFCDYYCMNSCCHIIQGRNLCCYCHNMDCIYCCIHNACRACCFQKQICQCMLECCKHMPICLLVDCLKNCGACEAICGCLSNCDFGCICDLIKGCDCHCLGQICQVVCGILFCFCK